MSELRADTLGAASPRREGALTFGEALLALACLQTLTHNRATALSILREFTKRT